jgi:hypothetical protein
MPNPALAESVFCRGEIEVTNSDVARCALVQGATFCHKAQHALSESPGAYPAAFAAVRRAVSSTIPCERNFS